jgi:hypothetical protein
MDPDETLRLYNQAIAEACDLVDGEAIAACNAFLEAAQHMENLFGWLKAGGFAPDWARA